MISEIFHKYQVLINTASGSVIQFREQVSGALCLEGKITSLSGNSISPALPVEQTKFSLTQFDASRAVRIRGIDNHEHKPLHQHLSGSEVILSGSHTLSSIGSYAFIEFFT